MARAIPHVAETSRKWATTGIGLGTIPFIVHPIDSLIHYVMDNTTRYGVKEDNKMIHLEPISSPALNNDNCPQPKWASLSVTNKFKV